MYTNTLGIKLDNYRPIIPSPKEILGPEHISKP